MNGPAPEYVGLTLEEARQKAKENGTCVKVSIEDGQVMGTTCDYVPGRIDLALKDGKVVSANFGH